MVVRIVPDDTNINFFAAARITFGGSVVLLVISVILFFTMGLNYGIDFTGGTTIRTEASQAIDTGAYRERLEALDLGDVAVNEVFDPTFAADQHVAQIRIQAGGGESAISSDVLEQIRLALVEVDPSLRITQTESVSGKVSDELIWTAVLSVTAALVAISLYIWLRFEWQFAVGALVGLLHDVWLTIGLFALLQMKFDLTTIAALLTIVGYSINDTVVVFDRTREILRKYKTMPLFDVLNLAANQTLSRTIMTSGTTLLVLLALLILGGDVIRGFVFAITWGIIVGTYSSIYIAKNIVLMLGVKRDWDKPKGPVGGQYANIDA